MRFTSIHHSMASASMAMSTMHLKHSALLGIHTQKITHTCCYERANRIVYARFARTTGKMPIELLMKDKAETQSGRAVTLPLTMAIDHGYTSLARTRR